MIDLMLDVESMGIGPYAALVGIGAVFFDENTGLGAEFYRAINLATSVKRNTDAGYIGVLDPSTIMFWLGQDDAARQAIMWNTNHVDEALADFVQFTTSRVPADQLRVWGCSPTFDCQKVQHALQASSLDTPWRYYNERCYRTIRERNPSVEQDEREGLHNALEDAKFQAEHLLKIRRAARERARVA